MISFPFFLDSKSILQSVKLLALASKKGVKMTLCGMKYIDLMDDIIKILGIFFSYNKKLEQENYFLNLIVKYFKIMETKKFNY